MLMLSKISDPFAGFFIGSDRPITAGVRRLFLLATAFTALARCRSSSRLKWAAVGLAPILGPSCHSLFSVAHLPMPAEMTDSLGLRSRLIAFRLGKQRRQIPEGRGSRGTIRSAGLEALAVRQIMLAIFARFFAHRD
jgi:Na+/melibiose symporter-like transporter